MTTSSGKFVGVDVAKDKLDITVLEEKKASQVGNDERGIAKLIKELQMLKPDLIVVEATGWLPYHLRPVYKVSCAGYLTHPSDFLEFQAGNSSGDCSFPSKLGAVYLVNTRWDRLDNRFQENTPITSS